MKTSTVVAFVVAVLVVAGGWYWWMENAPAPAVVQQTDTSSSGQNGPGAYMPDNLLLGTDATSSLGTYLIGSNAMTLYTYTKDAPGVSNCTAQCAANWPPYTIPSRDVLANVQAGISGKVDALTRADGAMQVTYNGAPLYFWINDKKSGDTTGQNVGGVWFVAKP